MNMTSRIWTSSYGSKLGWFLLVSCGTLSGIWTTLRWKEHEIRLCKEEAASSIASSLLNQQGWNSTDTISLCLLEEFTCVRSGILYVKDPSGVRVLRSYPEILPISPPAIVPPRYWKTGGHLWLTNSILYYTPWPSQEDTLLLCLDLPLSGMAPQGFWLRLWAISILPFFLAGSVYWTWSSCGLSSPASKPLPESHEQPPPFPMNPPSSLLSKEGSPVIAYLDSSLRVWPLTAGWTPTKDVQDESPLHLRELFEHQEAGERLHQLVEAVQRKGRPLCSELISNGMIARVIPLSFEEKIPVQFAVLFSLSGKEDPYAVSNHADKSALPDGIQPSSCPRGPGKERGLTSEKPLPGRGTLGRPGTVPESHSLL